ncbi:MAG TPA: hypothetical protein DCY51_03050 [Bacteroidetes bacterium]|nr:hypothetical protein [Bacteroidota bacterium]
MSEKPEQANRFNERKPKFSFLDLTSFEETVFVLEFGATKYARDNWKKGMPIMDLLDSTMRHIAALLRGEFIDPESGLPHHGHIGCNVMFIGYVFKNYPQFVPENLRAQVQKYSIPKDWNVKA